MATHPEAYLAELERHHRRNSWLFYADGFVFLFGIAAMFPSTILAGYIGHFSHSASATFSTYASGSR